MDADPEDRDPRARVLAGNLARVRRRIADAARDAGRDPTDITLIAVTKTFPADDARRLVELGVTDLGENRDQEASAKAAELAGTGVRWHFVGRLQRNKVASVASYAGMVHSVDRPELVTALDRAAGREGGLAGGRRLASLVQVNLDPSGPALARSRGGAEVDDVLSIATEIARSAHLRLAGVMAVAPLGAEPDPAFARLAEVARRVRGRHPDATVVSAGMSGDLAAAIRNGATHVRIGTALLGGRHDPVR